MHLSRVDIQLLVLLGDELTSEGVQGDALQDEPGDHAQRLLHRQKAVPVELPLHLLLLPEVNGIYIIIMILSGRIGIYTIFVLHMKMTLKASSLVIG